MQDPTEVNLDAEMMASPSGEEHVVTSQSSRSILYYANVRILGLRKIKIIKEKDNNRYGIPRIFGLISLFASVDMSSTKSMIPQTVIFSAKIIHHLGKRKLLSINILNFTNHLVSNTEEEK